MEAKLETGSKRRIKLNIGGTMFQTNMSTLKTFSGSKLANIELYGEYYSVEDNEYFFDRNPAMFAHILDGCRKGTIHVPRDVCGITFKQELDFWKISAGEVASCCWQTLYQSEDDTLTINELVKYYSNNTNYGLLKQELKSLREQLWLFFDEPMSSVPAMIWGICMTLIVLLVILVENLMTLPELSVRNDETLFNAGIMNELSDKMGYDNSSVEAMISLQPNPVFVNIILVAHVILSLEFIVTLILCPNKIEFFKSIVRNLVLVGYISYWVCYVIEKNMAKVLNGQELQIIYLIVTHLRVLEAFRLFYVSKNVPSFHVIGVTFSSSRHELSVLFSILGILVLLFSKFILYVEIFKEGNIQNGFQAMYWALITLTTVGYGDYIPATTGGHVIACACALCGLMVLSMPIGVIASTFYTFFNFRTFVHKHFERYGNDMKKLIQQCSPNTVNNADVPSNSR